MQAVRGKKLTKARRRACRNSKGLNGVGWGTDSISYNMDVYFRHVYIYQSKDFMKCVHLFFLEIYQAYSEELVSFFPG